MSTGGNGKQQRPSNGEKLLGGITGKGFMPGQSGNPKGRRKGLRDCETAFRKACEEQGIEPDTFLVKVGMKQAASKGGGTYWKELMDRYFGTLAQRHEVEHGGAVKVYTSDVMDRV